MMVTINADELIRFSRTLENEKLKALSRRKTFTVKVTNVGLEFTPLSTSISRKHPVKWLDRVCKEFSRTNSFHPSDYANITANASHVLAIIFRYLKNDPD